MLLLAIAILTVAVLLQLFVKGTVAALKEFPKNIAILKGEQVTLACSTNLATTLDWSVNPTGSKPIQVFGGAGINPEFEQSLSVDGSLPGQSNLNIKKADENVTGFWKCIETADAQTESSAELIVLESEPWCYELHNSNSTDFENVTLVCKVDFRGNWPPTIKWIRNNENNTQGAELETIPNASVTSTLKVPKSEIAGKNVDFTCETFFRAEAYNGNASATNVPEYSNRCTVQISGSAGISTSPKPWPLWLVILCAILFADLILRLCFLIIWICYRRRLQMGHGNDNLGLSQIPLQPLSPNQNGGINTHSSRNDTVL